MKEMTIDYWSPHPHSIGSRHVFLPISLIPGAFALWHFRFGMGVDQVVEVEMVGADGSLIVANGEKHNFKRS